MSIRGDIAQSRFCFPQKVPLVWKLKDFLEDNVDEKYYLTEKGIGRLIKKSNKLIRTMQNSEINSCLIAGYHKMDGRNNQYTTENSKVEKIIGMYDTENKKHQAGSVYNPEGISPTLTTMSNGGSKQPFILVKEGTKVGYAKAKVGDSINISYPSSTTKRGRIGKEVSQTILTSPNMATLENIDKPICINNKHNKLKIQDRVYDTEGISTSIVASNFRTKIAEKTMFNPYNDKEITDIAPCQTTSCGNTTSSSTVLVSEDGKHYMRIRKLTPLECWRLMGFDDNDFYKAKSVGISDTQLYKQAGNSIVVNVLEYIFEELLYESELQKSA